MCIRDRGTGLDLKNIAADFDIAVNLNSLHQVRNQDDQNVRVSSTLVRKALADGLPKVAKVMLGRPYSLRGEVVTGQQLGRTIGFPTANLKLPIDKLLPKFGVYSVDVLLNQTVIRGVMNIGCRPTLEGESPSTEVHLLNWSGDLYGQTLKVDLIDFLRPEQKFPSVEALKQQITKDCQAVLNN